MIIHKSPFSWFYFTAFISFISLPVFEAKAQNLGRMIGTVKDAKTEEWLVGATVVLEGTSLGGVVDINGRFTINNIPPKTYNVTASLLGYKSLTKFDIVVTTGNTANVNFELEESTTEVSEVVITASPFKRLAESPNSIQSLSRQEIQSYPGGNNDVVKVVQSLPGVAGSAGFRNDLIIRGGAPNENVFYLDGVEIPNINHFATQGAAGGPVGLLNVTFIEDVTLSTSAFNARYDNPLSSVLQFKQRTGNPDRLQGNFRLGASEVGLTMEGPLGKENGNTTFIVSARRSYLQLLFSLIGLPFLPGYWDYQYKINHKFSNRDELSLIGLGSIDDFKFNPPTFPGADAAPDVLENYFERLAIFERIPLFSQRTNTVGLSWKHFTKNGYLNLTLSTNRLRNIITKNEDNDPAKRLLNDLNSVENESKIRYENVSFFGSWTVTYGGVVQHALYTNRFFALQQPAFAPPFEINFNSRIDFLRYGAFVQANRSFLQQRLNLSGGLRTDGNSFTNTGNDIWRTLSPRVAASYALTENWNINASLGRYFKIPPYTALGFKSNNGEFLNRSLEYIRSDHAVAGLEYLPYPSTRITLEGFYKNYSNYLVSVNDSVSIANFGGGFGTVGNEELRSDGLMRTYGLEFCFQQKLTNNFYGIFAYTLFRAEATGFDKSKFIPTAWDNRHLVTFTGGYKLPKNWEVNARYRFQASTPYTPVDTLASLFQFENGSPTVLDFKRANSERLRGFQSLDVRVDKKWNFAKWSLNFYLDIQNVLNTLNPTPPSFTVRRDSNGNIVTRSGEPYVRGITPPTDLIPRLLPGDSGARLPTIGIFVEF
jgi:hypothetical protein